MLIDNGHGLMTPGKRSPDSKFREAFYTREITKRIVADLIDRGITSELLVQEEDDIPLSERARRVNSACLSPTVMPGPTGHPNVILISIHVNDAGNGSK